MADKEVKFTEEEMKQINVLQQGYVNLQNALGQLGVNRIRLNQQFDELDTAEENVRVQFSENQTKERDFVDGINKKYGDGNLDLTSGVFTPKPVEETNNIIMGKMSQVQRKLSPSKVVFGLEGNATNEQVGKK